MQALPLAVDALVIALGVFSGFRYGRTLFAAGVRLSSPDLIKQARALSVLGLVFIFGNTAYSLVKNYSALYWFVPWEIDYYGQTGIWLINTTLIALFFSVAVTISMLERHRLRFALLSLTAFIVVAGPPAYHLYVRPVPPELHIERLSNDGVVLQSGGDSCAAAACANICRFYGMPRTEKEMVAILGTTHDGTSPAQVIYGMRSLGFHCVKRYSRKADLSAFHAPAVLFIDLVDQPEGHAVAYMGAKDGQFEIWDSQVGKVHWSPEEAKTRWHGRGIEVWPPAD